MAELIILLSFLLSMMYLTYAAGKKDVLSPSFILVCGYIVAVLFAIYNVGRWNSEISLIVVALVCIGISCFFLIETFCKKVRLKESLKGQPYYINKQLTALVIKPINWKLILVIALCIAFLIILYKEVHRVAYSDYKNWGNLVYNYRQNRRETSISGLAQQGNRLTRACAIVYLFAFFNNITENKEIKLKDILKNGFLLIPAIIYSIQSLLLGGRIYIIALGFSCFFFKVLLDYLKYHKTLKVNIPKIIKAIIAIVVICILFFNVQKLIGRDQASMSVLDYIATYLGGSMDLFSQYVRNPMGHSASHETFGGIVSNLQEYLGLFKNVSVTASHEFRQATSGFVIGNTYTGFRNYFNDYGLLGVIFCSFLFSAILSGIYYMIKRYSKLSLFRLAFILILAEEFYCIFFHFFCDYFLAGISVNRIFGYFLLYIIAYFVFGRRIKESVYI